MARSCPIPPSQASACELVRGKPGGASKMALATLGRALVLTPGLALAGLRGGQLMRGALYGAAGISVFLVVYTAANDRRRP